MPDVRSSDLSQSRLPCVTRSDCYYIASVRDDLASHSLLLLDLLSKHLSVSLVLLLVQVVLYQKLASKVLFFLQLQQLRDFFVLLNLNLLLCKFGLFVLCTLRYYSERPGSLVGRGGVTCVVAVGASV